MLDFHALQNFFLSKQDTWKGKQNIHFSGSEHFAAIRITRVQHKFLNHTALLREKEYCFMERHIQPGELFDLLSDFST